MDEKNKKKELTYWVNGQELTESQFQNKKQEVDSQPGYQLVENGVRSYTTRIQG